MTFISFASFQQLLRSSKNQNDFKMECVSNAVNVKQDSADKSIYKKYFLDVFNPVAKGKNCKEQAGR